MESWSVGAEYPSSGEPFFLVIEDDSTQAEAQYIATQILSTFRLTGAFLPTSTKHALRGHYLFTYTVQPETLWRLGTIWAESCADAELRLNILASDGILFMPSPG